MGSSGATDNRNDRVQLKTSMADRTVSLEDSRVRMALDAPRAATGYGRDGNLGTPPGSGNVYGYTAMAGYEASGWTRLNPVAPGVQGPAPSRAVKTPSNPFNPSQNVSATQSDPTSVAAYDAGLLDDLVYRPDEGGPPALGDLVYRPDEDGEPVIRDLLYRPGDEAGIVFVGDSLSTEPPGGWESPFWAGLWGGATGAGHGSVFIANAVTCGLIPGLDRFANELAEKNGGAYRVAKVSGEVGVFILSVVSGKAELDAALKGARALKAAGAAGVLIKIDGTLQILVDAGTTVETIQAAAAGTMHIIRAGQLGSNLALSTGGGAPDTGPNYTKEMLSRSETIARGRDIRKIDELVEKFGGTRKGWVKKKGWDSSGQEWHWY